MTPATFNEATLVRLRLANAFLDYEADLLDRHAYREWLELWDESGLYIVPIEREVVDFGSQLNHIFDDHRMRTQRIERLLSGNAPSAAPIMRTVRSVSRVRLLDADETLLRIASALTIVTYKRQVQKMIAADVTHWVATDGERVRIQQKVVRLIDSDEPIGELSFML